MNQELDYAEMLEIPVSTVNVVKKKSFFKRRRPAKTEQEQLPEDLKERVVESVNERVGAYVYSEDVSDPPKEEKRKFSFSIKKDKASLVLFTEAVAVGVDHFPDQHVYAVQRDKYVYKHFLDFQKRPQGAQLYGIYACARRKRVIRRGG